MIRSVLIVDDSAFVRRALRKMVGRHWPDAEFYYAASGEEGLVTAIERCPDVVLLDIEMPRMDGFTFLRLLMQRQPLPVIVVTSHGDPQNILKALELGALDLIPKPTSHASESIYAIEGQLVEKLRLIENSKLHLRSTRAVRRPPIFEGLPGPGRPRKQHPTIHTEPKRLVGIGTSTGGPSTVSEILAAVQLPEHAAIVVVQHMPAGFTTAFAERLDRQLEYPVREIRHLDRLDAGTIYVCPGGHDTLLKRARELRLHVVDPEPDALYVPNVNRFFTSAAEALGRRFAAVVLTGMGNDGAEGAARVRRSGGIVIAEDPESAVVNGMPQAVVERGLAQYVLETQAIAGAIEQWLRGLMPAAPPTADG